MCLQLAKGDSIKTLISDIKTIESNLAEQLRFVDCKKAVGSDPVNTVLAMHIGARVWIPSTEVTPALTE